MVKRMLQILSTVGWKGSQMKGEGGGRELAAKQKAAAKYIQSAHGFSPTLGVISVGKRRPNEVKRKPNLHYSAR